MGIRPGHRRWTAAIILASLGLAACGGDTTQPVPPPGPPPPPPPPPAVAVSITPSSATVEAGQTQQFTATVTNTTNTGVTWTSSGGTLSGSGATVTWTAPSAAGTYSVTAASVADPTKSASSSVSVALPNPVRVVLDDVSLGTSGGTLTVTDAASPLFGLTIAVPPGAYQTSTRWSVAEIGNVTPTLPPGAQQVGPTIRFTNGQVAYAELPFTITLPARVASDHAVLAFYFDAATDTWDPLPLLGRTDSTITVMTRHVSGSNLLTPAPATSVRMGPFLGRLLTATGEGSADVVTVSVPVAALGGVASSDFRPALDDWPFVNRGSWLTPDGYSFGAASSSVYHFMTRREHWGRLFADDPIPNLNYDNARGIRLASVIQHNLFLTTAVHDRMSFLIDSAASVGEDWAVNQSRALALSIWLKGSPRLILVGPRAHSNRIQMMVAFDMNAWKFGVSSTQEPGVARQITFDGTDWVPFDFGPSADEPREPFGTVFLVGSAALFPTRTLDTYFERYDNLTIGNALFPALEKEYMDPVDPDHWRPLDPQERLVTASKEVHVRTLCAQCGFQRSGAEPSRILSVLFAMDGRELASDEDDAVKGTEVALPEADASYQYGLLHAWRVVNGGVFKTIDWSDLDIRRVDFTVVAEPSDPVPGQQVTFRVVNGGIGNAGMQYRWTIGTPPISTEITTAFDSPEIERTFNAAMGKVVVELVDQSERPRARAEVRLSNASFQGLGFYLGGNSNGLSEDGSVIVGNDGSRPIRWTAAGGVQVLSTSTGLARGVSADGSVVVGMVNNRPFRWTAAGGIQFLHTTGVAYGVTPNGLVVVGADKLAADPTARAFRWTAAGGMQMLGALVVNGSSSAHAVSADGSIVVGQGTRAGGREAFRWTEATGIQGLGHLGHAPNNPNSFSGGALAISTDGNVIVGASSAPDGNQGFRWENGNMMGLGAWPGNSAEASGVSGDGSVIVGNVLSGSGAFIWTAQRGLRELKTALEQEYGLDVTGWTLTRVNGISRDGRVLAGYGMNPQGQFEGWRAVLPASTALRQAAPNGKLRR